MNTRGEPVVPAFTISVLGSSCNFLCFGHIFAPLFSVFIKRHPQGSMGCQEIDREKKEKRMRPKTPRRPKFHELPYTVIVKSGTIIFNDDQYVRCRVFINLLLYYLPTFSLILHNQSYFFHLLSLIFHSLCKNTWIVPIVPSKLKSGELPPILSMPPKIGSVSRKFSVN